MSENTFNIDVIVQNQNGLKWCPTKSLASSLFYCDPSHSITSSMLCDGFRDCPNGLDEMLSMCRPDEPVYIIPILSVYVTTFCLALFFMSCRKQKQPRQEPTLGGFTYQWENSKVVFLKSTLYFLVAFCFLKANM